MKTVFDIKIDFEKSHGSYVFDKKTNTEFLDFYSMFSSLPLGYNHPVFDESFDKKVKAVSKVRMTNNLFYSDELQEFHQAFRPHIFSDYFHICCTGALAVESAIKCAMEYKCVNAPMVLGLKRSFHGINSWGFITDRYMGTGERIKNFPKNSWENLEILEVKNYLQTQDLSNLVAVIVEPIQATSGDIHLNPVELQELRQLCKDKDICYIVDEIQTGFGVTGDMWYSDKIDLNPDVLVFGKKSQVCGIVATEKYNECMTTPLRKLEVTFDGDLIDAIRATYILKAYEQGDLINRTQINNKRFKSILEENVLNFRSIGHLIAFDFESKEERDGFVKRCYDKKFLCNPTGEKSIRMRPNMAVTENEIEHFEKVIKQVI